MKILTNLIRFAEKSKGLQTKDKIKLLLFLKKVKPNTEILLKVGPKNLGEKYLLEKLLKQNKVLFSVSNPKSYEEVKKIKGDKVMWEIKGTYYSYDIFRSKKDKEKFRHYLDLLDKGKYNQGDKIAGEHYGYPKCCLTRFVKEKSTTSEDYVKTEDVVTLPKRQRMLKTAKHFLSEYKIENKPCRFDIVVVTLNVDKDEMIRHHKHAFKP